MQYLLLVQFCAVSAGVPLGRDMDYELQGINSSVLDHLDNFINFSSLNNLNLQDQHAVENNQSDAGEEVLTKSKTAHVQVNPINTNDPAQMIKTKNKAEDETVRSQSGNGETAPGIYDDSVQYATKDDGIDMSNENAKQNEAILKRIQKEYEADPAILATYLKPKSPLIAISRTDPFSVTLAVRPYSYDAYTMVRLMYERVPLSKPALPQNLDDPVIEYVPMYRGEQEHRLYNLPVGKYIICGEAFSKGTVFQANCLEARVKKNSTKELPGGVVGIIAIALLIVMVVIIYAIYHRLVIYKLEKDN